MKKKPGSLPAEGSFKEVIGMANVIINRELCKGCELCITGCKQGILAVDKGTINKKGFNPVRADIEKKCVGCSNCAIICPDSAIRIEK